MIRGGINLKRYIFQAKTVFMVIKMKFNDIMVVSQDLFC